MSTDKMDNKFSRDADSIPSEACAFAGGEVAFESNGEGAKTVKFKMQARSGQPIEHWFWGKVAHDMSGLKLHKQRVTIDYCHDTKDIIGYGSHFKATDEGLEVTGALTPSARNSASEIIELGRQGVPYEASINFGGDGIKVEEVREGQVAMVNGYELEGPAAIIREWPLRGVAVCPYGADMHTSTNFKSDSKEVKFSLIENDIDKEVLDMSVENNDTEILENEAVETETTEVTELTEETNEPEQKEQNEKAATQEVELEEEKAEVVEETEVDEDAVEEVKAEATDEALAVDSENEKEEQREVVELSLSEYRELAKRFGSDHAEQAVDLKCNFSEAVEAGYKAKMTELEQAQKEIAELKAENEKLKNVPAKGVRPVAFTANDSGTKSKGFFQK